MKEQQKLEYLHCAFPKLTEANQQFMLGIAKGLKYAQNNKPRGHLKKMKSGGEKTNVLQKQ